MAKTKKTAKGRYTPIQIPLVDKKMEWNEIKTIRQIQREAIDNFIAHKGIEIIPFGVSGNPESTRQRGWGKKKHG
jgi:hypothetical protein